MTEKVVFVLGSCRLQTGESKIFGPAARASPPTEETWFCIFIHLKLDACMLFRNPKLNFCKRWRGVAIWGGRGQVGKGVVSYPTRCSFSFILGPLHWSSSWQWQPCIVYPSVDFFGLCCGQNWPILPNVFAKCIFYIWDEATKFVWCGLDGF